MTQKQANEIRATLQDLHRYAIQMYDTLEGEIRQKITRMHDTLEDMLHRIEVMQEVTEEEFWTTAVEAMKAAEKVTNELPQTERNQLIAECVRKGLECRSVLRMWYDYSEKYQSGFYLTDARPPGWSYGPPAEVLQTWSNDNLTGLLYLMEGLCKALAANDNYWRDYIEDDKWRLVNAAYKALGIYWRETANDDIEEAARLVVRQKSSSPFLIQRELQVGFDRAVEIVYELERMGIVSLFEDETVLLKNETELDAHLLRLRERSL